MKSAPFNERVGIVSEIREAASRRPSRCCLGNPVHAKVDLLTTLAKQTGRHTVVTSSQPGRPKRSSEVARQSLTGSDNRGRDMSMTPFDLSRIIYDLRDPVLRVEFQVRDVADNPGPLRLFHVPSPDV